mgnify:CR=1 FL=1
MKTFLLAIPEALQSKIPLAQIEALAPGRRVVMTADRAAIEKVLDEVEVVAGLMPLDLIARAPKLRWFQQWGAGASWLLRYPKIATSDIIITNTSGIHAIPISEHIFAMLLAFARGLHKTMPAQQRHAWMAPHNILFELPGKTMVLVGVGAIGARTAQIAQAMGMHVIGVRRDPSQDVVGVDRMVGSEELQAVLPEADVVVLTVPLTSETRGMLGAQELKLMSTSAYLINIGRGGTVDEDALVRALREGQIAGAGLDVFETEPLPEDSPLWGMENVIITAHYAGSTPHYTERVMEIFLDNLRRYLKDEPMRNVVDKELGY